MTSDITKFDAMAAWFSFSDGFDHFYLADGSHVAINFFDINSILENRAHMKEVSEILGKRLEFVKSNQGLSFFMHNFIAPING